MPPPVMWAKPWTGDGAPQRGHGGRVDDRRPQQLVGQRARGAGPRRVVEPPRPARAARVGPASSRSSAGPGDGSPTARRPARRRGRDDPGALDDAHREAGEVDRPGPSPCSATSPPTSAQPACRQPSATPRHDASTTAGLQPADADVVEEEQRVGALARRCRRRTWRRGRCRWCRSGRSASATFSLVPTPSVDDTSTGLAVAGRDGDQAAEAADVGEHLGPVRGADSGADAPDDLVAGLDVDAGGARRSHPRQAPERGRRAEGPTAACLALDRPSPPASTHAAVGSTGTATG